MDVSRRAPATYCVFHECSLQNLPEHLITVTLKRIQVVPAVKERRGSWISEDEQMEEHIFHSTRGRAEVVCDDPTATRAVLSLGRWSMRYKPQAERLQTHDSGMEQRPHQGGQTTTKRGNKDTHSVLSEAVCRTAGLTLCKVLAERVEASNSTCWCIHSALRGKALSVASGPCRGRASQVQGVSLVFQDTECPSFHTTLNIAPYFSWCSVGERCLLLEGQPLHWAKRETGFPLMPCQQILNPCRGCNDPTFLVLEQLLFTSLSFNLDLFIWLCQIFSLVVAHRPQSKWA